MDQVGAVVKRHYITCSDCHTRMARTGKKEKECRSLEGQWLCKREYECNKCGKIMIYWESRNLSFPGSFSTR